MMMSVEIKGVKIDLEKFGQDKWTRWSETGETRVCIADKGGPQIPVREGHLARTNRGHAERPDGVRGMSHAEERGHTTRARPVRGKRPETRCSQSTNRGHATRLGAVRGDRR
ncbi:hypothetical protein F2Q69_00008371 [Brassica cretica]|uniref:Uncharacterized protein n=1 Tax=Brassica cretica TaxID=69181 RepID=A0A8S9P0A6_BRACR|nr:hypothetical protein F2Q69_00008371 [Brassica cretica]